MPNTPDPQAAVVERVARHLAARDWLTTDDRWDGATASFRADYLAAAREVLALVPSAAETTNRAAVLRWAAEQLLASDLGPRPGHTEDYGNGWSDATLRAQSYLLGLAQIANEAEFAATPCSPVVPCEDGGEPCDVHERLLGHYDDSHELCAPDCGTADGPSRVAAEEQPAETQDALPGPGTPRCATCTHPKSDHDGRADHRARFSPIVAGEPWCHACEAPCDYAERPAVGEQPDTQTREARVGRCSAVMLRVHHAPHGWEPQPGMDPVHCPGYPQPAP
ncbi:hypothetical protein QA942_19720 [Streptomyces sp. B21-106]|uniref:hypothetical protein n=1 Tax=Streptomyces sp. B21-106 TaxID=3039418 RepID=UPI002FF12532